jgi:hypothetical protein
VQNYFAEKQGALDQPQLLMLCVAMDIIHEANMIYFEVEQRTEIKGYSI